MICRFMQGAARHDFTPVDNLFLSEYMPHADGLAAKAYLYGLMQCYHPSMADVPIFDALGVSEDEVLAAFLYWQQQGLVQILSDSPLTVEYKLSDMIGEEGNAIPAKYENLVRSLQTLTAPRQFGMRELKHVYDWVEVYGLEEDAVLTLVSHCVENRGMRVSINYMSAVAESFAEANVHTQQDALAYIEAFRLRRSGAAEILRKWSKRRKPTEDEMARYEKWTTEWGFTPEAILSALPRLSVAGTPNFVYLDELLDDMRRANIVTAEDVASDDATDVRERDFARLLFERAGRIEPATKTQRKQIGMYLHQFEMPPELLLYAAELSRGASEPFGMMKKLLNDWHEKGISDIAAAQKEQEARQIAPEKPRGTRKNPAAYGYAQHEVSEAELSHLLVDLDKDVE